MAKTMRAIKELNDKELEMGASYGQGASWHNEYKNNPYIFVGNLDYSLNEGDVKTIFEQYGKIVYMNFVRDKATGKSRGIAFLEYEDPRSAVLAVDNFNCTEVLSRQLRVDHAKDYKKPEVKEDDSDEDDDSDSEDSQGNKKRKREPVEELTPEEQRRLKKLKREKKKRKREKKAKREKERIAMMKQGFSKGGPRLDDIIRQKNREKREKKERKEAKKLSKKVKKEPRESKPDSERREYRDDYRSRDDRRRDRRSRSRSRGRDRRDDRRDRDRRSRDRRDRDRRDSDRRDRDVRDPVLVDVKKEPNPPPDEDSDDFSC